MLEPVAALIVAAVGGMATTLFKTIKFVQEGELGIRLRFGRATRNSDGTPKIINPGFVLLIPFVETLKRHHVRQQTLRMDNQKVMISDGLIFNVSAVVIFRVKDIYKALFEIHELDASVVDLSMGILRDILSHKKYNDFSSMDTISNELLHRLQEKAEEWGINFIQFKLTNCAPTSETAPIVNVQAGVKLKVEALRMAAEQMGSTLQEMSPALATALIGIPLVAAVSPDVHVYQRTGKTNSLFNLNLRGKSDNGSDSEEEV